MSIKSKTIITRSEANATLTIERIFPASRERVWAAFTDPKILDQWWAPKPYRAQTLYMDFKVGGYWHYAMTGPEGEQHFGRQNYLEIEPQLRFTADDVFADASGATDETLPAQRLETTFSDQGQETKVAVVVTYASAEDMQRIIEMGVEQGLAMAQDQLEALLSRE